MNNFNSTTLYLLLWTYFNYAVIKTVLVDESVRDNFIWELNWTILGNVTAFSKAFLTLKSTDQMK